MDPLAEAGGFCFLPWTNLLKRRCHFFFFHKTALLADIRFAIHPVKGKLPDGPFNNEWGIIFGHVLMAPIIIPILIRRKILILLNCLNWAKCPPERPSGRARDGGMGGIWIPGYRHGHKTVEVFSGYSLGILWVFSGYSLDILWECSAGLVSLESLQAVPRQYPGNKATITLLFPYHIAYYKHATPYIHRSNSAATSI